MKSSYIDFISKPEISFWLPIATSFVMATTAFGFINTRISVLENKVDTVILQQERMLIKYTDVENRYGQLSLQVARLEEQVRK